MPTLAFYPYDFTYKIRENKPYIYLYGKDTKGKKVCVIYHYQAYFYADLDEKKAETHLKNITTTVKDKTYKVTHWERVEREFLGVKKSYLKVFVDIPKGVPSLAKALTEQGVATYEKDILYVYRTLRDLHITPTFLTTAQGEEISNNLFLANSLEQKGEQPLEKWHTLAVDIETYATTKQILPEKNPILMIALYGKDEQGNIYQHFLTWKKFAHKVKGTQVLKDEKEMLQTFVDLVKQHQPDILTGYFSDGFDLPYIATRAKKHNIKIDFGYNNKELWVSQATDFRQSECKVEGMVHIDVLKFIRNVFGGNLKTTSYSLDAVAHELLGSKKHDIDISQLAQAWDSDAKSLADYAAYNVQDTKLTLELCEKLFDDMLSFATLVGVPLYDVIRMRFSRLVENYILKHAVLQDVLAPNKPSNHELEQRMRESITGGFVYQPTPGVYKDVVVFDFRSLYPTIIVSHNLGPESFKVGDKKNTVPGKPTYWFSQEKKAFLPHLLKEIIHLRLAVKQQLKKKKDHLLESRSYALKILANSFYGYLVFYGARWYSLPSGASTTAYARHYIQSTMKKAEQQGFSICYGDSLTPDRKIFVKSSKGEVKLVSIGEFVDNHIGNKSIEEYSTLSFDGKKTVFRPIRKVIRHSYNSNKKGKILAITTTHGQTKVTPQHSVYTFSQEGPQLTNAADLKIGDALVSLTEPPEVATYNEGYMFDLASSSFGNYQEEMFLYKDTLRFPAQKGKCPYCGEFCLLSSHVFAKHADRKIPLSSEASQEYIHIGTKNAKTGRIPRYWKLTKELAWILGYYCADGSVSDVQTASGRKCLLSFGGQDLVKIKRVKRYFDRILSADLKIIKDLDKRTGKKMYYYRIQRVPIVPLFSLIFDCGKGSEKKRVPSFILSSQVNLRDSFLRGYLAGDGRQNIAKRYATLFHQCCTKSKELACGIHYLFKSLDGGVSKHKRKIRHVHWKYRPDKPKISTLRYQTAKNNSLEKDSYCAAKITKIEEFTYDGFVYDLEVEGTHNFVDAEGLLLVHNTDSLFVGLKNHSKKDALAFMASINKELPGEMELEFEAYCPRALFVPMRGSERGAKKKYALLREDDTMKVTGFSSVRRNTIALAKQVQKEVLRLSLHEKEKEALEYVHQVIAQLQEGQVNQEDLVITTRITKKLEQYKAKGPHVAAAERLQAQGEEIYPGMSVRYIITKGKGLVRERARLPQEVKKGDYDVDYYMSHHILPAVSSIFAVFGYEEKDILTKSKQEGLGKFF